MSAFDKPLMVQSDRTLLLDVHSPSSEKCRNEIIAFSDLIKSPEHIHTFLITPLSIWNALSSSLKEEEIISTLKRWSRYEIDNRVLFFISDMAKRYGEFVLESTDNDDYYSLKCKSKEFFLFIKKDESISKYLKEGEEENSFLLNKIYRGTIKERMIKKGFPITDNLPFKESEPFIFKTKENLILRDYQEKARDAFLNSGKYGTIVLPCGSGKTVVGISIMEKIGKKTLILCPSVTSLHQWKNELLDKTNIKEEDIGEYSSEKKEIRNITLSTYQILIHRDSTKDEESISAYPHFSLFSKNNWGLVIYDEVHMLPSPVFRITAEFQSIYRLGLTATLIREDGKEDLVFSLVGPKRIDIPWLELEEKKYIANATCHEIRVKLPSSLMLDYALSSRHDKFKIAATNSEKTIVVKELLKKHKDDQVLIIGQYIEQLKEYEKIFSFPLITGSTPNKKREELYSLFRENKIKCLIVSKVANFAVDLPDANVAIELSGTFGSRQEEAQRLGRILRPKDKEVHFYTIITEYTTEEEAASKRQKFLSEQGYSYTIEKY